MSGLSYSDICPNCDMNMSCYSDHKPYDTVSGSCLHCGFYYYTNSGQDTLEDLNAAREEFNDDWEIEPEDPDYLEPLLKLPEVRRWLR